MDDPIRCGDALNLLENVDLETLASHTFQGDCGVDFWNYFPAFNKDFGLVNDTILPCDEPSTTEQFNLEETLQSNWGSSTNIGCANEGLYPPNTTELALFEAEFSVGNDVDGKARPAEAVPYVLANDSSDLDFAGLRPLTEACLQAEMDVSANCDPESSLPSTTQPRLKRKRGAEKSAQGNAGRLGKRAISTHDRDLLEQAFLRDPYPSKKDIVSLSEKTSLSWMSVRIWFSNARSRKSTLQNFRNKSSEITASKSEKEHIDAPQSLSALSVAALDDLNSSTSGPGLDSLERYLTSPSNEEPVAAAILESAVLRNTEIEARTDLLRESHDVLIAANAREIFAAKKDDWKRKEQENLQMARDAFGPGNSYWPMAVSMKSTFQAHEEMKSILQDSDSSVGSVRSFSGSVHSFSSQKSVDSRGSRRGRKRWRQCTPPMNRGASTHLPEIHSTSQMSPSRLKSYLINGSAASVNTTRMEAVPKLPMFCTWPGCESRFRYKYEWARHEEAIHYCPYHWICCLDTSTIMRLPHCFVCDEKDVLLSHLIECHFSNCANRSEEERTFVREDQLTQHIKGVHLATKETTYSKRVSLPKDLLASWKIDNPALSRASLHCGFCGVTLQTWAQRQDHVYAHFQRGTCEAGWWPERLPTFTIPNIISSDPMDFSPHPIKNDHFVLTWSCRYLLDFHAIFSSSGPIIRGSIICCKLCSFTTPVKNNGRLSIQDCKDHAEQHALRSCDQTVFTDRNSFTNHLLGEHGAESDCVIHHTTSWRCIQHTEISEGQKLVHTMLPIDEDYLCDVKQPGFFCTSLVSCTDAIS
ncbi:hypothetical protein IQ07DRAFT_273914 [Pyrenochaeta sp. DS3sAY3a]|nr:hypothetical protein IQ07DRAFT_273914 [Pyrenochaeta sp. DS3sAY3a]